MAQQLSLLNLLPKTPCKHKSRFVTMAYVPAGIVSRSVESCCCNTYHSLLMCWGYKSADWTWGVTFMAKSGQPRSLRWLEKLLKNKIKKDRSGAGNFYRPRPEPKQLR